MLTFRVQMGFAPHACDEAASALRSLVGPVRAEAGCVATRLLTETDARCGLIWEEEWRARDDFERHLRTPTFRQILAVIEMADEPPKVEIDDVNSRRGFELIEEILSRDREEYAGLGDR